MKKIEELNIVQDTTELRIGRSGSRMTDYEKGYQQALKDINKPKLVIKKEWNPSKCPTCKKDFYPEYESCYDGYYSRPKALTRCPYCGQKLDWN